MELLSKNLNLALQTIRRAPKARRSYITRGETSPEPTIIKPIRPEVEDVAAAEVVDENPTLGRRTNLQETSRNTANCTKVMVITPPGVVVSGRS